MRALALVAGALLAMASTADAGGRGGHGGSHGHSGGRGRSGRSAHSSGHSRGCTEVNEVLGYRRCSGFGAWSLNAPALSIDLGLAAHRFVSQRVDESGTFMEGARSFGYRIVGEPGERITTAVAPQLRIGLRLSGPFYVANELEIGGVAYGPSVRAELDGAPAGGVSRTYVAVRGVAGLSIQTAPLMFSGEIAGGMRLLTYKIQDEAASSFQGRAELQARARIDVWLGPRMTIGATVGASVLERGDRFIALSVGGHLRAFGGAR